MDLRGSGVPKRLVEHLLAHLLRCLCIAQTTVTFAQAVPDSGRVLQELAQPPAKPQQDGEFPLTPPAALQGVQPGGAVVEVRSVQVAGNSVFSRQELLRQLGDVSGRRLDLAGLRALADVIATYYRQHGFPFTRAFVPQQDVSNGELRIQIVEGRYGQVLPGGDPQLGRGAARFLQPLRAGDLIETTRLERALLLLDNQPGMRISPIMSRGGQPGEGDLTANVERVAHFGGEIGADNEGDRYTGMYREKVTAYAYSPFRFGDMVTLRGIHTNQNLWVGAVDYEMPLNGTGLRGHVDYTRTTYHLGGEFESLGASGFANIASAGVSYPIVRSRQRNLIVALDYQYQSLQDRYAVSGTIDNKFCNCWPLSLQFDNRDNFLGGGISYGSLVFTTGTLRLNAALSSVDSLTARTAGTFGKLNLDVSRVQLLTRSMNWMVRYAAQFTDKNLDSSQQFNLGGVYGVRAYPVGEGIGARGWLFQTELRYALRDFVPYLLYDAAHARTNVHLWDEASGTERSLSGTGFGARYIHSGWALDASIAWRLTGGHPLADSRDPHPRIWVSASYRM
jgi:hemolysin activation/secretion protein